jgi:hypothetical protein
MATEPFGDWKTGSVLLVSAKHLHALGAITLLYNDLEHTMALLLDDYLGAGQDVSEEIFVRLNNRSRVDVVRKLAEMKEKDPEAKNASLHAVTCFEICAENRNTIMHLVQQWSELLPANMIAKKRSSDKSRDVFYSLSADRLRQVADEMLATRQFVRGVSMFLYQRKMTEKDQRPPSAKPPALPKTPPLPSKLSPLQPRSNP